jgi:hypothetical protein
LDLNCPWGDGHNHLPSTSTTSPPFSHFPNEMISGWA